MVWKALVKSINPKVASSDFKGTQVGIGFPDEREPFIFSVTGNIDPKFIAEKLREWLEAHLRGNGVSFDE